MSVALSEAAVAVAVLVEVVLAEGDDVGLAGQAVRGRQHVAPVDQRPAAREVDAALRLDLAAWKSKEKIGTSGNAGIT